MASSFGRDLINTFHASQTEELNRRIAEIASRPSAVGTMAQIAQEGLASRIFEHLVDHVTKFEEEIGEEFEVGMEVANFGQPVKFRVTAIGYQNPSILIFTGVSEGTIVRLMQHVHQLSFLLVAFPKAPEQPRQRVGFWTPDDGDSE